MAEYKYVAMDNRGARRIGTVDARTKESAVEVLKNEGYYVVSLEKKSSNFLSGSFNFRGVPFNEVVSFTRQFSTMVSAGLPVSKILNILTEQSTNAKFKIILGDILRNVEGGSSLANAFSKYPEVFSPTYQALVEAGEASGKLDEILSRLAKTMEEERELRAKIKGAMIYPVIVLMAMAGVFVILMVFVVPKLADMYESLDVELPAVTQFMITVSDFWVNNLWLLFIIAILGFFGLRYFLKSEQFMNIRARYLFKIPIFGPLNRKKELTEFTRTLSLLLTSAVPIVEALHIVSDVVSAKMLKDGALAAADRIEKGGSLSGYLKSDPHFPPILGSMVATGEETGRLDEVLEKLAEFFSKETEHAIAGLSAAMEPVILIMLGAMVGVMIVSIITPIYKITSAI